MFSQQCHEYFYVYMFGTQYMDGFQCVYLISALCYVNQEWNDLSVNHHVPTAFPKAAGKLNIRFITTSTILV